MMLVRVQPIRSLSCCPAAVLPYVQRALPYIHRCVLVHPHLSTPFPYPGQHRHRNAALLLRGLFSAAALTAITWSAPADPEPPAGMSGGAASPTRPWFLVPDGWVINCQRYNLHWLLFSLWDPAMLQVGAGVEAGAGVRAGAAIAVCDVASCDPCGSESFGGCELKGGPLV